MRENEQITNELKKAFVAKSFQEAFFYAEQLVQRKYPDEGTAISVAIHCALEAKLYKEAESDMASSESMNPSDISPVKSTKNSPNTDAQNAVAIGDGATATMDNTIILGGSTHDDRVSVGIGTNYPTSLASLELSGSDRGFLINRMTESEIGMFEMSLGVMEEGMMVYNIDRARLQTWTGTKWVSNNAADLSMNDHELSIDGGKKIDMRPYLDNKDEQSMKSATLDGNVLTIAIENGDPVSVDLTPVLQ
ncbi:hypothetical protein AC249_AIPGENE24086, partial [Exaiptasia diaphana]